MSHLNRNLLAFVIADIKAVIDEGFRWKRENKGSFHYNIKAKEIEDSDDDS